MGSEMCIRDRVRTRRAGGDHDVRIIGCRDGGDVVESPRRRELTVDDPPIGVDDVGCGQRLTVVPPNVRAQRENVLRLFGIDLPALCERRDHLELFVGFDESVEDVLEYLEREVGGGLVRVELIGLTGDRCPNCVGRTC